MSFIYCPSCGTKTEFTSVKPNFCINCGESLSPNSEKKVSAPTQQEVDANFKGLSSLSYEISQSPTNEITIGNTMGSPSIGSYSRKHYKSKTGSVVDDIIQDCGSSKGKDIGDVESK